ncbi:MAG: YodL domain-containing protein [Bacteroidales bacterium]|nr:YodL domain-containing protein [Bacteroidales bacterium]
MASLRDAVKSYQEELKDGIAWVVFWREGRSWNSECFHLDGDDLLSPEDKSRLEEISSIDPAAVSLNGYYCGQLGEDMSLDELTAGVHHHYENHTNSLVSFLEMHDDTLPPELLEEARKIAHDAGLPFYEKPYRGEDFDPYVYDGNMSIEDYDLMHQRIAKERSEKMSEQFSILIDSRSRFETGTPGGVWLSMPTTTEQLHEAMKSVGISPDNPQDFFINGFGNTEDCPFDVPLAVIQNGSMDELNYLGNLLSLQSDEDKAKFAAAVTHGERAGNLKDLINLAQNLDCYWLYPTVQSEEDYGYYLIDELDELELPEEVKKYFDYEAYGRDAVINDGGRLTEQGYIYNNKNTFTEWYDGRDVPQEYRVMPQPVPTRPDPSKVEMDAIGAVPPTPSTTEQPHPVIPIILTGEKSGEKMKEITDRLEQGILELFDSDRFKAYLSTMSKFHDYSLNNTLLIAMQGGSLVRGYNQWKSEFGRNVKQGEKAIKIIAPTPYKVRKQTEKIDPNTQKPVIGKDGKPVTEETEVTIPAFKVVSVFDVSQTEGKELPSIGVNELLGDVEHFKDFYAALEKASPVPIGFEQIGGSAHGYYHLEEKRIAIDEGMSELQTLKTAIHEIAHAKLHDIDLSIPKTEQPRIDKRTREVEAESVAYTVCQHYGLDTSDYSFGYVAGWSSGKELAELKGSLQTIHKAAAELITAIDGHIAELQKSQEQTQEQPAPEQIVEQETPVSETKPAPKLPQEKTDEQTTAAPQEAQPAAVKYYAINETAARRAKDANSFSDYKPGSATAEYKQYVDEAAALAERQKARVDPMYHEKIDSLLDTYARKLAANMNNRFAIDARVPSILIAGGSNFPVRKKEKQNAARDTNYREWQDIQGLLDKIRSTGRGGISADDPQAVQKLEHKLADLEQSQETMKAVNAYYRKHKTLDGCPALTPERIEKLKASMESGYHLEGKPYPTWALSNNSAEIRRVKSRIADLSKKKEIGFVGWEFDGGKVEANTQDNRLQIFFEEKPDEATRAELKSNGFRWSPKAERWQRQLTDNAYYAANYIKVIQPLTGEKPTELLRAHSKAQQAKTAEPATPEVIYKMHTNPSSDSIENRSFLQAYIPQEDGKAKIGDILFVGTPEKCRELLEQLNTGELTQGQVKELFTKAQEQPTPTQTAEQDTPKQAEPDKDTFTIYQLKGGDETRGFRFEPYDRLQVAGLTLDRGNYELTYTAPLDSTMSLDSIYERFNIDHPKDFTGHSLSVSDVVVLHQNGQDTAHYVDSLGFRNVPEFLQPQTPALVPDEHLTGEKVQTPRGSFSLTSMSVEQMKEAGYGFHHQSDDGKYDIMTSNNRAFAVAVEPPEKVNPLKYVEDTIEQNDNNFDGIINNTPTVDELEAKVKAGEQISLTTLAEAIKADKERGKGKEEKPSIRAQLKADKARAQKKPPKSKSQDLERS